MLRVTFAASLEDTGRLLSPGQWDLRAACKGTLGKSLLPSRKSCRRGKPSSSYSGHGNVCCCSHLGTIIKSITNMDCREERSQSSLSLLSYKVNLRTLNFCYNHSPTEYYVSYEFVTNGFYYIEVCFFYTKSVERFHHARMLKFCQMFFQYLLR